MFSSSVYNINNAREELNRSANTIIVPFFANCKKVYLISFVLSKFIHMIPASAPTGVKIAPIFEPIIVA